MALANGQFSQIAMGGAGSTTASPSGSSPIGNTASRPTQVTATGDKGINITLKPTSVPKTEIGSGGTGGGRPGYETTGGKGGGRPGQSSSDRNQGTSSSTSVKPSTGSSNLGAVLNAARNLVINQIGEANQTAISLISTYLTRHKNATAKEVADYVLKQMNNMSANSRDEEITQKVPVNNTGHIADADVTNPAGAINQGTPDVHPSPSQDKPSGTTIKRPIATGRKQIPQGGGGYGQRRRKKRRKN